MIINTDHCISCDQIDKTSLEFSEEKIKCILSKCVHIVCVSVSVCERGQQREREERETVGLLSVCGRVFI